MGSASVGSCGVCCGSMGDTSMSDVSVVGVATRDAVVLLFMLFTNIQHIVRTYDSRQSCLWSAKRGDQITS